MDRKYRTQSALRAVRCKDAKIFWTCFVEYENKQMAQPNENAKTNK